VVAPVQALLPAVAPPPIESSDTATASKQTSKPKARNSIGTNAVKPTSSTGGPKSGSSTNLSTASPEMKGACPIPGACGPSVPPDAVKRP
jgi:hypothetical protein